MNWSLVYAARMLQLMSFFWNSIVNFFKSKLIGFIVTQSLNDLKDKFPDSIAGTRVLKDTHDWHNSSDRATEDEISWRSPHAPFDEKTLR